jgi:hypothetical protein
MHHYVVLCNPWRACHRHLCAGDVIWVCLLVLTSPVTRIKHQPAGHMQSGFNTTRYSISAPGVAAVLGWRLLLVSRCFDAGLRVGGSVEASAAACVVRGTMLAARSHAAAVDR